MSKPRILDLIGFIGSMFNSILNLLRSIFGIFFPRDEARAADAMAAHVDHQTERLLSAEDEPTPTYDLANTVRRFLRGEDVSIGHLPPRQRLAAILMFEHHFDVDMLSDGDIESYVRGDNAARGLPDLWTKDTFNRCYAKYLSPQDAKGVHVEPDVEPAYGM